MVQKGLSIIVAVCCVILPEISARGQVPTEAGLEIKLTKVPQPPAVRMLMPGFRVRELPIKLTNINNVRYRDDGKLITLGYDGDLNLLSDTDGDGLEDTAKLFWKNEKSLRGPIGLLLTPPNYARGRGAFVPSKGKLSLIVDKNGDDSADEEIVVAIGWKEIPQNVDAVAIAMDKAGWLYFGLGTANYANAYLVDDAGKAAYDLASERGTVQRVSPDFSRRETVCTGIRFPIAMAFNQYGDLFCSEQEGATWLANGNPFDELLHIQPGRHYGFPPRHPRHNPLVIDEPSTFDYAPQHQSTCGMVFNEPVNGGPVFGPAHWSGDAIVCGESRGKLWRTKLVRTPLGYVAATQLFACLQMLTIDACVAPDGDLVVACHSGPPDWGTGPAGEGKLFRIEMIEADAPRPTLAYAESPHEIRIAFDQPLDTSTLKRLATETRVEYGEFVRAGDRFENLVPPYKVVQHQLQSPRYSLPVTGVAITSDLRNIIINTAAMNSQHHYAVQLPIGNLISGSSQSASGDASSPDSIDVDLAHNGLSAHWLPNAPVGDSKTPAAGALLPTGQWTGWLPHYDLSVSKALTHGSSEHDRLWSAVRGKGELTLRGKLDLHHMLRPKVQPLSEVDYQLPAEQVTVSFTSSHPFKLNSQASQTMALAGGGSAHRCQLAVAGESLDLVDVVLQLNAPDLTIAFSTNEDDRMRPFPLNRLYMPWASRSKTTEAKPTDAPLTAELEGGNWGRGRQLFHSEVAGCAKCHTLAGAGAQLAPDLSNLIHRDYASVRRDIENPSYAINPDFLGNIVLLKNGQILNGVLKTVDGTLMLGDAKGVVTRLVQDDIERIEPAKVSNMPTGLAEKLSQDQLRDLMSYLLQPPPRMKTYPPLAAPPIRTQAEVAAVLANSAPANSPWRPMHIVLVSGKKDHGPGEHDYPDWQIQWNQLLSSAASTTVSTAIDFPSDQQLSQADVIVFFQKGNWNDARQSRTDQFLARGGGAVYVHWAVNGEERVEDMSRRIGLASRGGKIKFRHGPLTLDLHNIEHPIMRNFSTLQLYDESYWMLTGRQQDVTLLASSIEDSAPQPQMWTFEKGPGRVFVSIPGHYNWTFDDPLFRILLLRGMAWTAKESVDRFNELVPLGARMSR